MSLVILYPNISLNSLYRGGAEKQENDKPDMEWGNVCVTSQYPFYPPTNISSISSALHPKDQIYPAKQIDQLEHWAIEVPLGFLKTWYASRFTAPSAILISSTSMTLEVSFSFLFHLLYHFKRHISFNREHKSKPVKREIFLNVKELRLIGKHTQSIRFWSVSIFC